jgi:hypothetical protein
MLFFNVLPALCLFLLCLCVCSILTSLFGSPDLLIVGHPAAVLLMLTRRYGPSPLH